MKAQVIPGVSLEDSWVASHFSAALCCVFLSSYTDEKSRTGARAGPHELHGSIALPCVASQTAAVSFHLQ